ncbi:phosphoribosyltransferase family protein [Flavobacterium enshiense]|uniref:ComF family protein n=1 Tax=Flavobacterium enshiense TaxID=1341165 RepID=UPI00345D7101
MNAIKNLLNLLFPKFCRGCKSLLLTHETTICLQCRHELPFTQHLSNPENEVFKRFYGRVPLEHASSVVYYHKKGMVQQLIHHLKYKGTQDVGSFFGTLYGNAISNHDILSTVDEVIPVPLHPKKLRERGYNQVTAFGKSLAEEMKINYNETLLKRNQYSKTQTQKNIFSRTEMNNKTLFEASYTNKDHGKHFLLVDDVITTGSTLEACGKALLKIPEARISIISIAYTHS